MLVIEIDEQNGPAVAGPFCEEISLYISPRPLNNSMSKFIEFQNGLQNQYFERFVPILQYYFLSILFQLPHHNGTSS